MFCQTFKVGVRDRSIPMLALRSELTFLSSKSNFCKAAMSPSLPIVTKKGRSVFMYSAVWKEAPEGPSLAMDLPFAVGFFKDCK